MGNENLTVSSLAVDLNKIYAGSYNGIYISSDSGHNWVNYKNRFADTAISSILIYSDTLIVATEDDHALYFSYDSLNSFVKKSTGLIDDEIISLTFCGKNIFAGTYSNGIYINQNNSNIWSYNGLGGQSIPVLLNANNNIFVGTYGLGIWESTDNGNRWINKSGLMNNNKVLSMAYKGNYLFAGTDEGGVYISTKDGNDWILKIDGLTSYSIRALAVDDKYVYAGTRSQGIFRAKLNDITTIDESIVETTEIQIYPNPANEQLIVTLNDETNSRNLEIVDILGISIQKYDATEKTITINIKDLPKGIYFIRTENQSKMFVKK